MILLLLIYFAVTNAQLDLPHVKPTNKPVYDGSEPYPEPFPEPKPYPEPTPNPTGGHYETYYLYTNDPNYNKNNGKLHEKTYVKVRRNGCRLTKSYKDLITGQKCKVLRCEGQKLVLCQPDGERGDVTTYADKGTVKINMMTKDQGLQNRFEEEDLELGFVGIGKVLIRLLERDPFEGSN